MSTFATKTKRNRHTDDMDSLGSALTSMSLSSSSSAPVVPVAPVAPVVAAPVASLSVASLKPVKLQIKRAEESLGLVRGVFSEDRCVQFMLPVLSKFGTIPDHKSAFKFNPKRDVKDRLYYEVEVTFTEFNQKPETVQLLNDIAHSDGNIGRINFRYGRDDRYWLVSAVAHSNQPKFKRELDVHQILASKGVAFPDKSVSDADRIAQLEELVLALHTSLSHANQTERILTDTLQNTFNTLQQTEFELLQTKGMVVEANDEIQRLAQQNEDLGQQLYGR
jgi:hypothetical protein